MGSYSARDTAASLALLVPGIPPRDRRVLLALASMPIVLSDTREP
jgi:hypothetical protein